MTEEKFQEIDPNAYILFLILILLIMGSQNTFDNYFELLDRQVSGINNVFNIFSSTAEGLHTLFMKSKPDQNDKNENIF